MARLTHAVARRLLPRPAVKEVVLAALVHDVGKVFLEPDIIRKPAALTPAERRRVGLSGSLPVGFPDAAGAALPNGGEESVGPGAGAGATAPSTLLPPLESAEPALPGVSPSPVTPAPPTASPAPAPLGGGLSSPLPSAPSEPPAALLP